MLSKVVYGIDMTSRADRIVTSGRAKSDISQKQLDNIREKAENELADGDYYEGCVKYIKGIEKKLNTRLFDKLTYNMPIKLGISVVIAVVAVPGSPSILIVFLMARLPSASAER